MKKFLLPAIVIVGIAFIALMTVNLINRIVYNNAHTEGVTTLADQIVVNKIASMYAQNFRENMDTVEELSSNPFYPSHTATVAIALLHTLHEDGILEIIIENDVFYGSPVYHTVSLIAETAGTEHAQSIAEMLEWDELYLEADRSTRGKILDMLSEFGTKKEISYILTFSEKVKNVDYERCSHRSKPIHEPVFFLPLYEHNCSKTFRFRGYDKNEAKSAIREIKERSRWWCL